MTDITYHTPMKKLSDATEYNGVIYLAGQVAEDLNAGMKAQTADVLRQIDTLLAKCGSSKSRILSATVYVTDMSLKADMASLAARGKTPSAAPRRPSHSKVKVRQSGKK